MKTFEMDEFRCVNCGEWINSASAIRHEHKPSEGDVTICLYCKAVMVFNADLSLRNPTTEELAEIEKSNLVRTTLEALRSSFGHSIVHQKYET